MARAQPGRDYTKAATSSAASGFQTLVREGRRRQRTHRPAWLGNGAPGGTRTHDLQVRNLTLYPLSYGRNAAQVNGGEGGIRTLEAGYPTWRFSKPLH